MTKQIYVKTRIPTSVHDRMITIDQIQKKKEKERKKGGISV